MCRVWVCCHPKYSWGVQGLLGLGQCAECGFAAILSIPGVSRVYLDLDSVQECGFAAILSIPGVSRDYLDYDSAECGSTVCI